MHHIIIHFTGLTGNAKTLNLQNPYDFVYSNTENLYFTILALEGVHKSASHGD